MSRRKLAARAGLGEWVSSAIKCPSATCGSVPACAYRVAILTKAFAKVPRRGLEAQANPFRFRDFRLCDASPARHVHL
jgi:hypothetical protein